MPELFGINIAGLIRDSINAAGGVLTGTLTKSTPGVRDPANLAAGRPQTTTDYTFEGFFEVRTTMRLERTLVAMQGRLVAILGDSLTAGIEPEPGDVVTIESQTFTIAEIVSRDPAAAVYRCRVVE